jgi:hypothetical protein
MTAEVKAATAAASPWEQATLFINGKKVEWGVGPVLLRGQQNDVTVETPPAIARALNLGLAEGGGLNIVASPDFGDWVAPVDGKFGWKITPDAGKSGRITLVFFSREVVVPWEHPSLVISSDLADEVTVMLDGEEMNSGGGCFIGGQAKILTLRYKNADVLNDFPLALDWIAGDGLIEGDFTCEPAFHHMSRRHEWTLIGTKSKEGTFRLKLFSDAEATMLLTPINQLQNKPILRFHYAASNQDAPMPPEFASERVNEWYGIDTRLNHPDGAPIVDALVTIHKPEHNFDNGYTNIYGVCKSHQAYRYATPGLRTFEAVTTLSNGEEVRATVLVNFEPR